MEPTAHVLSLFLVLVPLPEPPFHIPTPANGALGTRDFESPQACATFKRKVEAHVQMVERASGRRYILEFMQDCVPR